MPRRGIDIAKGHRVLEDTGFTEIERLCQVRSGVFTPSVQVVEFHVLLCAEEGVRPVKPPAASRRAVPSRAESA